MRITGFAGAVKKDLPFVYFMNCECPLNTAGDCVAIVTCNRGTFNIDSLTFSKYRYLFGFVETTEGKRGGCVVQLQFSYIEVGVIETEPFHIQGIGDFVLIWEPALHPGDENDNCCIINVGVEDGVLVDEERFTSTVFDEDGNYVSGSVFILV